MNKVRAFAFPIVIGICVLASLSSSGAEQKTIKDQAEYNAYITALNLQDPAQKAAAMEAFLQQYPLSVVKMEALEQAMVAYQQSSNTSKVFDTAKRILQLDPNSIRALAIVAAVDRNKATTGDQAALKEGCASSQAGSRQLEHWMKPEEMSDSDFATLRRQMADIFYGALGFCALQAKNYVAARESFTKAYELDPTNLQDVYQLAVADLEMNPIDVNGLWYAARAVNLAKGNDAAVKSITFYAKAKYKRFHGGEDGWDQLVSGAAGQSGLPAGFTVKPAPTPADLAVMAVEQNAPESLSFSDKEFILSFRDASPANKEAADKVWASIQTMEKNGAARLEIPVKIISSTRDTIDAAISDDSQAANKADLHVIMEKPMLTPPAANSETKIVGVITSYTPQPFMFTMEHGELPASKAR